MANGVTVGYGWMMVGGWTDDEKNNPAQWRDYIGFSLSEFELSDFVGETMQCLFYLVDSCHILYYITQQRYGY